MFLVWKYQGSEQLIICIYYTILTIAIEEFLGGFRIDALMPLKVFLMTLPTFYILKKYLRD
jgi:hypothetical protein